MSDSNSPSKKIKRVALAINSENQIPTKSDNDPLLKSVKELKEVAANMQQQLNVIQGQLKVVIEAVAENKVVVAKLLRQHYDELPIFKQFPITSEENLMKLNGDINAENRAQYVKVVTSILETGGVLKNFKYIIDDKVSLEFNVDGVHGKKSLKKLENIYSVILEAVSSHKDSCGSPEEQIRKAIQRQKKRQFKYKCVSKTIENNNNI